jgi:hypothetical protein
MVFRTHLHARADRASYLIASEIGSSICLRLHCSCIQFAACLQSSCGRADVSKGAHTSRARPGAPQLGAAPGTKFPNLLLIKRSHGGSCW